MNKMIGLCLLLLAPPIIALRKKGADIPKVNQVLVFAPHPDDDILGCGGALIRHGSEGAHCSIVYMTSGEAPGNKKDKKVFANRREDEARKGAKKLGITDINFLLEPDGKLMLSDEVIEKVFTILSLYKPDLIYIPHVWMPIRTIEQPT